MPGQLVLTHLVDLLDAGHAGASATERAALYARAFDDVQAAYNYSLGADNFAAGTGHYFPALVASPDAYLHRTSPAVKAWLAALRARGARLFLLTNSHVDYVAHLLDHCWGPGWRDVFDLVLAQGRKPDFFTATRADQPFSTVALADDGSVGVGAPAAALALGAQFLHGNHACLMRFLHEHAACSRGMKPEAAAALAAADAAPLVAEPAAAGSTTAPAVTVCYFGDQRTRVHACRRVPVRPHPRPFGSQCKATCWPCATTRRGRQWPSSRSCCC